MREEEKRIQKGQGRTKSLDIDEKIKRFGRERKGREIIKHSRAHLGGAFGVWGWPIHRRSRRKRDQEGFRRGGDSKEGRGLWPIVRGAGPTGRG